MSARRRHKKNPEAARLAEASLAGQPASTVRAPAPANGQHDARFALRRPDQLTQPRQQRNAPKLPAAVAKPGVFVIGRHEVLAQQSNLPASAVPGQSAFDAMFKSSSFQSNLAKNTMKYFESVGYTYPEEFAGPPQEPHALSRHHRRRIAQHFKWRDIVLPSLVTPFLARKYDQTGTSPEAQDGCECGTGRQLKVSLAEWEGASNTQLHRFYTLTCAL